MFLRGSIIPIDVLDEDEELGWDTSDQVDQDKITASGTSPVAAVSGEEKPIIQVTSQDTLSSYGADGEKELMRKQIKVLVARVSELERSLAAANQEVEKYKAIIDSKDQKDMDVAIEPPTTVCQQPTMCDESPLSDESPVEVSDAVLSPFDSSVSADNSSNDDDKVQHPNEAILKKEVSQKNKSETSLANLDDEEWEDSAWS